MFGEMVDVLSRQGEADNCQRPIADPARVAAAVDKALLDTFGPRGVLAG